MDTFIQVLVSGLTVGSFYALVALGYTMVYGIVRLINFAHGDLVMVAAFIGWFVLDRTAVGDLPPVPQILIAATIAIGAGTYQESLTASKSLHLVGKCAAQVSITSNGGATSGITRSSQSFWSSLLKSSACRCAVRTSRRRRCMVSWI